MATTCNDHAVIQISIDDPNQLVGFFVEKGNTPEAKKLYDEVIYQDLYVHDEETAAEIMRKAKAVMETAGFTCGEVLTQTKVQWLELLFERPLTEQEIDEINNPQDYDYEEDPDE